jgi:hypothetical protein
MFLYGIGRADLVAKIHLLELPCYAALLWLMVTRFGAEGAALAWTLRVFVDTVLLFVVSRRLYPAAELRYGPVLAALIGVGALALGCVIASTAGRYGYAVLILAAFAVYAWKRLLTTHERLVLAKKLALK